MLLKLPDDLVLETEDDVRRLRDFLDAFLSLKAHRTPVEPSPQPSREEVPPARKNPVGVKTAEHLYIAALRALGGAGTGDEVYQKFVELGYDTGARDPRTAIKTYLRQPGKFVRLPSDEHGVTRWGLKEEE